MTDKISDARRYREIIRPTDSSKASQDFPNLKNDINLYNFLKSEYEREKSKLLQLINEGESENIIRSKRFFIFILCVGLFVYIWSIRCLSRHTR